jgi:hypothetical protein
LQQQGVIYQQSNLVIEDFKKQPTSHSQYMTLKIHLAFQSRDVTFIAPFVVIEEITHDLILGDDVCAKFDLITSPIPEIQERLNIAANRSKATFADA